MESKQVVKWYGASVLWRIKATTRANLIRAGATLAMEIRNKTLAVSAGGASKRAKGIRGDTSHAEHEKYRHSQPGEAPRKITGFLQRNVKSQPVEGKMEVRVGLFKNAIYGWYLEKGVRNEQGGWKIAPRPWLLSTLVRIQNRIATIAATGRDPDARDTSGRT